MKTKYFGQVDFTDDEKIIFENGIFGFEDQKDFVLINFEEDSDTMVNLQSLEDENISFILMNPFYLREDYQAGLSKQEMETLALEEDSKGVLFYVVCVVKEDIADSTVNLRCPIAINPDAKKGIQVILDNPAYSFKHALSSFSLGGI